MNFEDRKYVIITKDEVSLVDFSQVLEFSADHLRYSLDESKTFVKYYGEQPSFLSGKPELTIAEMKSLTQTSEWHSDD